MGSKGSRCYECNRPMTFARLAAEPWLGYGGEVICGHCIQHKHIPAGETCLMYFNRDGRGGKDLHCVVLTPDP